MILVFSRSFFALAVAFAVASGLLLSGCLRAAPEVERGPGDGISRNGSLVIREGKLFSGKLTVHATDETLLIRESYYRGLQSGLTVENYPSGKIHWKREYSKGLKHGSHVGWWENGQKMFEYKYHRGDYVGVAREWYPDGDLAKETHYVDGRESGLQRAWRQNGALYSNYEAKGGRNYGVVNARLCYSVKDGQGVYTAGR